MIKPFIITCIVLILPLFFLLVFVISSYNKLAALRQRCQHAYAAVDAEIKRRSEWILRLIDALKADPELAPEALKAIVAARNTYISANVRAARNPGDPAALKALTAADTQLTSALDQLIALIEAHPGLKASQGVSALLRELASRDDEVDRACQAYNGLAGDYNTARGKFPKILIAASFRFAAAELLTVAEAAHEPRPS